MRPEDLEDRLARLLGDALSEVEERELLEFLEQSAGARDALGRHLLVDRLIRESRKASLSADRILRALPRGARGDFSRVVMERLPAGPRRSASFVPGLVAAALLAALLLYSTIRTSPLPASTVEAPEAHSTEPEIERRREVREERLLAEGERKRTEEAVALLRGKEAVAVRERERAEREREDESRTKAEEELRRLKTEREAEEARFVEAVERERRAVADAARPATAPSKTEVVVATIERAEGRRTLLAGQGLETAAKDGSAVLTFADRTRLELGPGTEIREVFEQELPAKGARGKRLMLTRGRITAVVSRQPAAQPFLLATPHGEAKVLGTTLRLTVEPSGTRLEVTEGKVRLSRLDGKSVDVMGGHSAVAAPGQDLAPKAILDRLHYEADLLKRPEFLFFEDFEQDGWKRHWSGPSEAALVTEDRALTLVGRRALEVRTRKGDGWHRLTMPNGSSTLHVRAYFYFPKDFDLGPDGGFSLLKVGALPAGVSSPDGTSLWADHRPNGRDFFSAELLLTGRWGLQFGIYHLDQSGAKGDWRDGDLPAAIPLKPGRWHTVELQCRANDPGRKNGLLRAWIDGTLCNEVDGLHFREVETLQLRELALMGGGAAAGGKSQSYYVDDVVVARDYIGAAFGDADGAEPRLKR